MDSPKANDQALAEYLKSSVRLEVLEKMTSVLDQELADSQRMLNEMKDMFNSIASHSQPVDNELRQEDLAKFLEADVTNLLLPDMEEGTLDADLTNIVANMKSYAEELKKNFSEVKPMENKLVGEPCNVDLEQYASSLDQLSKRLANIKLHKQTASNRNVELEDKLTQLCQDVNTFTQIVETKTTLSEHNQKWVEIKQSNNSLCYDAAINKLLAGINEVTYLLKSKN